ncbi:hypothetical protein MRB53_023867 [Persea americana]|uniref:Uncharacterized protein n=1 Tax=Persea americana TaxID=3435 RepID=A0ACC2LAR2_PERAE|nr:hypothetical protein MRB53_023867 [Persea americana]
MGCIDLDFDDQGAQVHAYAIKSGCTIDISIQTALLSLYAERLGAYDTGKSLHSYVIKVGVEDNKFVGCALIDMYANCGSMENAIHGVNPDHVVTFLTVLSSCSLSGLVDRVYRWDEAKKVREVMERKPLKEKKRKSDLLRSGSAAFASADLLRKGSSNDLRRERARKRRKCAET